MGNPSSNIRNVCIIAHVDHGKTTLVDHLLAQSGLFTRGMDRECVMDSYDLEREKGITILAKNASIRLGDSKINIVDTPGHADFGGEVERILNMVDGAVVLIDAGEGPLPQTRFVLEKAVAGGLALIIVVNKVDRQEISGTSRINQVVADTLDLLIDLGATSSQIESPVLYACGRRGWCTDDVTEIPALLSGETIGSLQPMLTLLTDYIPAPKIDSSGEFRMLAANLSFSDFVGMMAVGRVSGGEVKKNQRILRLGVDERGNEVSEHFQVSRIYSFSGVDQVEQESLSAGDIGMIAGCGHVQIGDTLVETETVPALPRIKVEQPTLGMIFAINSSPFAGLEGEAMQSRKLRERLLRETRGNVALRFEEDPGSDRFRLLGRGELQFAIIIEQMRREGLEFMVGRPQVISFFDENGVEVEPFERIICDVPEEFSGDVSELFGDRRAVMVEYEVLDAARSLTGNQRVKIVFEIPTRGLLGIRSRFLTVTHGEGIINAEFLRFATGLGEVPHRSCGTLISDRTGTAMEYALLSLEQRGVLFIDPGTRVYEGMILGECARPHDLDVNPCKEKKLTNVRTVLKDTFVKLRGRRHLTLEQCIEWIADDEWIEVTPKSIRLRKHNLSRVGRHNRSRGPD